MPEATIAAPKHVAIKVRDIDWHMVFFRDALGIPSERPPHEQY